MADPTLSIPDLCDRALGGEVLQEHEFEALLSARARRRRGGVRGGAREPARRVSATACSSTASSTSPRTAATRARSASTAPTTGRARATANRRTRSWPSATIWPAPAWCCLTSPWARTRSSTTSPATRGLLDLVSAVRDGSGLPVMVSPGVVPDDVLAGLAERGADWYALYQETHTRELYERLRVHQPFEARVARPRGRARAGMLVEDGMLTGIGDTAADRARAIASMRDAGWEQVRVMTFVPQAGTPLEDVRAGRRPGRAAHHRRAAARLPAGAHPRVARRRRHRRPGAAPERGRQRGHLHRAARRGGSPACRRASSTSKRATAPWRACCRTSRAWVALRHGGRVPRLARRGARGRR